MLWNLILAPYLQYDKEIGPNKQLNIHVDFNWEFYHQKFINQHQVHKEDTPKCDNFSDQLANPHQKNEPDDIYGLSPYVSHS